MSAARNRRAARHHPRDRPANRGPGRVATNSSHLDVYPTRPGFDGFPHRPPRATGDGVRALSGDRSPRADAVEPRGPDGDGHRRAPVRGGARAGVGARPIAVARTVSQRAHLAAHARHPHDRHRARAGRHRCGAGDRLTLGGAERGPVRGNPVRRARTRSRLRTVRRLRPLLRRARSRLPAGRRAARADDHSRAPSCLRSRRRRDGTWPSRTARSSGSCCAGFSAPTPGCSAG
jgi:hypothetical protein